MAAKEKILVVEDEKSILSFISAVLTSNGYDVISTGTGSTAYSMISSHCPDLVLLDLGLPDMDGMDVLRAMREWTHMPVIVVSARSHERDKVTALDAGADDYLTKPFSVDELLARIRVALRRVQFMQEQGGKNESIFENGTLKIDFAAGCVFVADEEIHLSPIEYKLLCLLAHNVGKVLTHNLILKEIWQNTLPNDTPSLRVYMATLRHKVEPPLGQKLIQTHVGIGYRMMRLTEEL